MNALPWILAGWLFVLTCLALLGGWRLLLHVKQSSLQLQAMLAAFGRPIATPWQTDYTHIKEAPPLKGPSGLAFYQQLHQSAFWGPLAHKFQGDVRELLLQAYTLNRDGKADAAMFAAGSAFYASQQAVLVEREIATIQSRLATEAQNKAIDALLEDGSQRPARH
jgi:hypothetical protein